MASGFTLCGFHKYIYYSYLPPTYNTTVGTHSVPEQRRPLSSVAAVVSATQAMSLIADHVAMGQPMHPAGAGKIYTGEPIDGDYTKSFHKACAVAAVAVVIHIAALRGKDPLWFAVPYMLMGMALGKAWIT